MMNDNSCLLLATTLIKDADTVMVGAAALEVGKI
jgi:hypothetical protein